ncbi:MAG: hypothetical protein ABGX16_19065, partial [Pirellulales bacterium]
MPEFTRIACGEAPKRKQEEDGYARFTRGQKAVDKAAATPENQAKIAEIRKTDRLIDHPVRFYTYADRLEG